ncbi:hypothetical protein [Chitinophaga caseinilytica]|uniref:hypothetical protein n=1 Tax=Chitinophaga caseinilytica TaxID=2267521 RepID=UPI003C305EAF
MVATLIFTENQTSKTIMGVDLSCRRACLNDLPRKSNFLQADMFGEEVMVLLEMVLNETIGGKAIVASIWKRSGQGLFIVIGWRCRGLPSQQPKQETV